MYITSTPVHAHRHRNMPSHALQEVGSSRLSLPSGRARGACEWSSAEQALEAEQAGKQRIWCKVVRWAQCAPPGEEGGVTLEGGQ